MSTSIGNEIASTLLMIPIGSFLGAWLLKIAIRFCMSSRSIRLTYWSAYRISLAVAFSQVLLGFLFVLCGVAIKQFSNEGTNDFIPVFMPWFFVLFLIIPVVLVPSALYGSMIKTENDKPIGLRGGCVVNCMMFVLVLGLGVICFLLILAVGVVLGL